MNWTPVSQGLPDDDETVLLALDDGDWCAGFHDGENGWKDSTAMPIGDERVTHWGVPEMPT